MKISVIVVHCPGCGWPIPAPDHGDTKLYEGRCPKCGKQIEALFDEYGELKEIRERIVH